MAVLGLSVGCSDDPPWPTCPTGPVGTSGTTSNTAGTTSGSDSGGAPSDAAGGMDDDGGSETTIGGRAGTSSGGRAQDGGRSGSSGAGTAGTGGGGSSAANLCGNGMIDGAESCDDGNTKYGDECAGNCSNKLCEECQQDLCWSQTDTLAVALDFCFNDPDGVAVDGPRATTPLRELCTNLYKCTRESGCMSDPTFSADPGQQIRCYCGTANEKTCREGGPQGLGEPQGPCIAEFQAAAETRDYFTLIHRYSDYSFALGRWYFQAVDCDYSMCGLECEAGKKKDACESCVVGTYEQGRGATLSECMVGKSEDRCPDIVSCARESKCAGFGTGPLEVLGPCYGAGTGPCHSQIEAAAGTIDPQQIDDQLRGKGSPSAALTDATQVLVIMRSDECYGTCFGTPP